MLVTALLSTAPLLPSWLPKFEQNRGSKRVISFFSLDIDECAEKTAQCDAKSTTCKNLNPGYECTCNDGYIPITNEKYKCQGTVPLQAKAKKENMQVNHFEV